MSKKKSKKTKPTFVSPVTEAKLRLADEEEEIIPLLVDEELESSNAEQDERVTVPTASKVNEVSGKVSLFENDVLVDRVELENEQDIGKSFRSKELTYEDLTEREAMPTLEDQWQLADTSNAHGNWMNRLILLGLLLLVAAGAWAFLNLKKDDIVKEKRAHELEQMELLSAKSDAEYKQKQLNVREAVKGYLEATTIEERAKWCRKPEETLRNMTEYYSDKLTFDHYQFDSVTITTEMEMFRKNIVLTASKVSNLSGDVSSGGNPVSLLLEEQAEGDYLVDWETAVVFQPSDWDRFVESKLTEEQTFRVDLRDRKDYGPYLYNFSDDDKYQAYRINIRKNDEKFLIAYTKKDSEIDIALKKLLNPTGRNKKDSKAAIPITIKVAFPDKAQSNQCVEISEIVSETWFVP